MNDNAIIIFICLILFWLSMLISVLRSILGTELLVILIGLSCVLFLGD